MLGCVTRHEPPEGAVACLLPAAEWLTGECRPECRVLLSGDMGVGGEGKC